MILDGLIDLIRVLTSVTTFVAAVWLLERASSPHWQGRRLYLATALLFFMGSIDSVLRIHEGFEPHLTPTRLVTSLLVISFCWSTRQGELWGDRGK